MSTKTSKTYYFFKGGKRRDVYNCIKPCYYSYMHSAQIWRIGDKMTLKTLGFVVFAFLYTPTRSGGIKWQWRLFWFSNFAFFYTPTRSPVSWSRKTKIDRKFFAWLLLNKVYISCMHWADLACLIIVIP